ncbi:MAG: ABC transporter ATP-binding protein [Candidatus Omnitrophica bacterium]|nr:ABC transporter ATP-binding protein [Candidatus Omnitrophota bacterium]
MNAITIKGLSKTYKNGTQALKNIDLEIREGDFFALLGANGAGKTTIINILTGLVIKSSGNIKIFDMDIDHNHQAAKRLMGVVPQEFNVNVFERVHDIVVNQAGYYGLNRKQALDRAEELLNAMDLWEKRNQVARELSGGMKRRLMITRALMHQPKLLILDEPTASVDVELRHGMWKYLHRLNDSGSTILLTTHYLEEVEQMCRTAAIIKEGQIIKNEPVKTLIQLLHLEEYIITVKKIQNIKKLSQYQIMVIDDHTFELEIDREHQLNNFLADLPKTGMKTTDIRTKGFRLEKLFINMLKD